MDAKFYKDTLDLFIKSLKKDGTLELKDKVLEWNSHSEEFVVTSRKYFYDVKTSYQDTILYAGENINVALEIFLND